jgi:hypothetical protein
MKKLVLAFAVIAAMCMASCEQKAENTENAQDTTATEQVTPAPVENAEQAPAAEGTEVKEGEQTEQKADAAATEQAPAEEQKAEEQPAK